MKFSFFKIFPFVLALLASFSAGAQELAVSTNFLDYANFATLNLEVDGGLTRHLSVGAAVKYNPFTFGQGENAILQRQQTYSAGARWWPWHIFSGWWLGAGARYQEFNTGGISSRRTSQGDRYGGTLSAGYSYMLSKHFNLDFGLGIWGGYEVYTTYECQHCGSVVDDGEKYFILPSDMIVSLTYIF